MPDPEEALMREVMGSLDGIPPQLVGIMASSTVHLIWRPHHSSMSLTLSQH